MQKKFKIQAFFKRHIYCGGTVVGKIMPPTKDAHVLTPGTHEYFRLHSKITKVAHRIKFAN